MNTLQEQAQILKSQTHILLRQIHAEREEKAKQAQIDRKNTLQRLKSETKLWFQHCQNEKKNRQDNLQSLRQYVSQLLHQFQEQRQAWFAQENIKSMPILSIRTKK
ncbi:MAG: hypothetical protein EAZ55_03785 [Cytophagales bacterium]|nr:MAG: hypothetical protein EAZ55_03785 [Cytophagales bacterium]